MCQWSVMHVVVVAVCVSNYVWAFESNISVVMLSMSMDVKCL